MADTRTYLVFDYETYSECDLKKAGAWQYSMHPSTEILCVAYRIGTRDELKDAETHLVLPRIRDRAHGEFCEALTNPEIKLVAHNALFEQVITRHVLTRYEMKYRVNLESQRLNEIPVSRWICTAALAATVGVPRHLDGACKALNLKHQKNAEGNKVMLKLCKPRNPSKNDPSTRWSDPADYQALYEYCIDDIAAEVELFLSLPPLTPMERRFWCLDTTMNLRGFAVDRPMVLGAIKAAQTLERDLKLELNQITDGYLQSTRQVKKTLDYLKEQGINLPNLQAATIGKALEIKTLPPRIRRILEIRRASGRSSPAKYQAFELRSRNNECRARGNTLFYGAHTGRQSGTGLQPQNLFKRVLPQSEVDCAVDILKTHPLMVADLWDQPVDVLASCIRSAIVAPSGYTLDVADFSTIEVRVLFWLCGHQAGLDAIKQGQDLYLDMASKIYDVSNKDLTKAYQAGEDAASKKRQLGKQTVLGAGFGIGAGGEKFQKSAKSYGLDISLELAQKAVATYRKIHYPVPKFWDTIERAAVTAMEKPGRNFRHGFVTWRKQGEYLTVQLPIGRKLYYFKPELKRQRTLYGDRPTLTYMGVNSVTKKFERQTTWGGKLTENVVQGVARDLLMAALLRIEETTPGRPVLAVHDEIIAERKIGQGSLSGFLKAMETVPDWAPGLPIKVEGWSGKRYKK